MCRKCDICQRATRLENRLQPNNPILAVLPFEEWGIDYVGPITPASKHGKSYIIVATDYLTKWSEARAVRRDDARSTATFLIESIICRFGAPAELVSDRGTHFLNDVVEDLTAYFHIRHDKTTPYKPSTNGQVESTNKILLTILRKTVDLHKRDWDEKLPAALWAYNTTFKVYGQECVLPIEHELSSLRCMHEHTLALGDLGQVRNESKAGRNRRSGRLLCTKQSVDMANYGLRCFMEMYVRRRMQMQVQPPRLVRHHHRCLPLCCGVVVSPGSWTSWPGLSGSGCNTLHVHALHGP